MRKLILASVIGAVCVTSTLAGAAPTCTPLKSKIKTRDAAGISAYLAANSFASIECFLSSLPKDILALRTYFKTPIAIQEGDEVHPRAMIGSPDGGLFMTFNGDPAHRGYDEVEVLALDQGAAPTAWVTGTIKMSHGKLAYAHETERCSACHGNPTRPIWGNYPRWPTAFGATDDWMPDPANPQKNAYNFDDDMKSGRISDTIVKAAEDERAAYLSFRASAQSNPRYAVLESVTDSSNPVYPYTEEYRTRNDAFRPNLIFGMLFLRGQNQILANRVAQSPFYKKYTASVQFTALADEDECDPLSKTETDIRGRFKDEYSKRFGGLTPFYLIQGNFGTQAWSVPLQLMGVSPHDLTLTFVDTPELLPQDDTHLDYLDGAGNTLFQTSLLWTVWNAVKAKQVADPLVYAPAAIKTYYDGVYANIPAALKNYPAMAYYKSAFMGEDFDIQLFNGTPLYRLGMTQVASYPKTNPQLVAANKKICDTLAAKAEKELAGPMLYTAPEIDPPPPPTTPYPAALSSCIECHDSGLSIGPDIPFRSQARLAAFMTDFVPSRGQTLADDVAAFTDPNGKPAHEGGLRMPLGRAPLTAPEIKSILDWIQGSSAVANPQAANTILN